jgi:hypothetical protein
MKKSVNRKVCRWYQQYLWKVVAKFVVDTSRKFSGGVIDTSGNFAAIVIDICGAP